MHLPAKRPAIEGKNKDTDSIANSLTNETLCANEPTRLNQLLGGPKKFQLMWTTN